MVDLAKGCDTKNQVVKFFNGKEEKCVELYSPEGMELLSILWAKVYVHKKLTHDVSWMGIPIIQFPEDILMMQELIWKLQPDIIIESGIAHGGSLIFYASLMELIGHGTIVGVDIDIRAHNRKAIEQHPMFPRIKLLQGSSIAPEVLTEVRFLVKDKKRVLVILDSNHSTAHVSREMELYHSLVTPGSYLVVMDGAQAYMDDIPQGKAEWTHDNPLVAIEKFLPDHPEFEVDPYYNRLKVTSNPKGFLRRKV